MQDQFTKEAKEIWDRLPKDFQEKVLKNVFCGRCLKAVEIIDYTGREEKGDLILKGKCKECGHSVGRLVEGY